ncbi:MAG TPA: carboxypeptidase-like regulatory domain-containing protein [Vicinamibacterales bacterium]
MLAARSWTAAALTVAVSFQPLLAQAPHDSVRLTSAPQSVYTKSIATIRGTTLTGTGNPLAEARVRLRNARSGRIVGTAISDHVGVFEFHSVEPGSYIVELVTSRDDVLAASDILHPNGGDVVSCIVKLPYQIPPAGGVLGHVNAAAIAVTAAAAAAGLLATQVTGQDVSPRR